MSSTLGNISTGNFQSYGSNKAPGLFSGTKDFLNSNSIIAKIAFLLLVLIVFVYVLRFGVSTLGYFMSPSSSPIILDGMIDANNMMIIPQNPALPNSIPILRSTDQRYGVEFTWSVWVYIQNLDPDNQYKHIFHKGNDNIEFGNGSTGLNFPNNAPGLYIAPNTNKLLIIMNTFNDINDQITVSDIPLNKWLNIVIRVKNTTLDVYINGTIVKRHNLIGVPKQNYGDVYVAMNGGFNGYISSLRYWNYALGVGRIENVVNSGPNMKMKHGDDLTASKPHYFSLRWFFNNDNATNMDYGAL